MSSTDKTVASIMIEYPGTVGIKPGHKVHIKELGMPYGRSPPGTLYYYYYTRRTAANGQSIKIIRDYEFSQEIRNKLGM